MKVKYERLIDVLKTYNEEEMIERREEEKLIEQLMKENEYLRNMLNINCNEEVLIDFDKEMKEKEGIYRENAVFAKEKTRKNMNFNEIKGINS